MYVCRAALTVVGGLRAWLGGPLGLLVDDAALLDEQPQALDLGLVLAQLGILWVLIADWLVLYRCSSKHKVHEYTHHIIGAV